MLNCGLSFCCSSLTQRSVLIGCGSYSAPRKWSSVTYLSPYESLTNWTRPANTQKLLNSNLSEYLTWFLLKTTQLLQSAKWWISALLVRCGVLSMSRLTRLRYLKFNVDFHSRLFKANLFQKSLPGVLLAQRLGRRTIDQAVVGSIPGRGVIRAPRSTQPSIPPG